MKSDCSTGVCPLQSRPYRPNPEMACEKCVFGSGEHADWCPWLEDTRSHEGPEPAPFKPAVEYMKMLLFVLFVIVVGFPALIVLGPYFYRPLRGGPRK